MEDLDTTGTLIIVSIDCQDTWTNTTATKYTTYMNNPSRWGGFFTEKSIDMSWIFVNSF